MRPEEKMKNGIFRTLSTIMIGFAFIQLSSCATLFDFAEDNPAEFDRGYRSGSEKACAGAACHTEADSVKAFSSSSAQASEGGGKRIRRAIDARDIILGMTRDEVLESWGSPAQREIAGTGGSGNERWTYGSRFSFGGSRTVIFEKGRVAGWYR
jgi:hypothetical protein